MNFIFIYVFISGIMITDKIIKKQIQNVFSRQKALWIAVGLACFPGIDMLADVTALSGENAGSESVMQKDRTVTVIVSDSSGELIGANVLVKGTTLGNVTDLNGCVVLQHVPSNAILEISFIGYKTKEVPVKDQSLIKVTLSEDSETLEEVVVVGYGTMEKKQVTSAVTSLSADDMLKGVGGADITTALQGKISGLLLQNNGSVNGGTTIQLRGMTSIYQGNSGIVFYTDVRV